MLVLFNSLESKTKKIDLTHGAKEGGEGIESLNYVIDYWRRPDDISGDGCRRE